MDVDQQSAKEVHSTFTAPPDAPASPPSLTQGLEDLLGGLDPLPDQHEATSTVPLPRNEENTIMLDAEPRADAPQAPEWEEDSSPYESSSSDSSSSDDSDDSDNDQDLLSPEQMARILMEAASDDEGDNKSKGAGGGGQVRTKNELAEEIIPKPDVNITPEMKIELLGEIEHVIDSAIVIKAFTSGEYRVLDTGSVLCTEDRTVVAALADLIGSVKEPRYMARFTSEDDVKALKLEVGSKIFYTPEHAAYVFTEPLKAIKGTDASNLNDEEPADDEMEFSDDEKEAAHKRELKAKRKGRNGGRGGAGPAARGGPGSSQEPRATSGSLNYDDEDDGPYRPLARPVNFGQGPPGFAHGSANGHDSFGRGGSYRGGRGDGRGRGRPYTRDGRGNRGNHRGRAGHSLPPRSQDHSQPPQHQQAAPPTSETHSQTVPPPPFFAPFGGAAPNFGFPFPAWPQPQNLPAGFVPPPPPQFQQGQGAQAPPNPLQFFANWQNQYQAQVQAQAQAQAQGSPQQPGQWPQQGNSG